MAKQMDGDYIAMARHSLAHVLARAVCELFEDVKLGIGPDIEHGFYYDFDLPHTLRDEDFPAIEARMAEILRGDDVYSKWDVAGLEKFGGQPYKLELLAEIQERGEGATAYSLGDFHDLCAGPHVENVRELRNWGFCIASVAGAYWRGSEKNPMLQRLYVHAFPSRAELKKHLQFLEEAAKRDHRILGNHQDLFFFDETAPGMPYWLPRGLKLYNALLAFSRETHEKRGYQEIAGPQLNSRALWETSGHWEHYQENMFCIDLDENSNYALKPMNCPNHIMAFKRKNRSYRDLPMRFFETSVLHRREPSGSLHGIMRVQAFRQDDSHNFITEAQIGEEINEILDIADYLYDTFGITYRPVLSTRPDEGYLGEIEVWDAAEEALRKVLDARYPGGYDINEGDGAFYGPKIDILIKDVLGREWQQATIQLDFQLCRRFDVKYTDSDGLLKHPVMIHRALYGSLERFIGGLIEHFAARFPFWISPMQIGIVPVHPQHEDYAREIAEKLRENAWRVDIDTSDGTMGNKIKSYRHQLIPYVIILGDAESGANTISVRTRNGKQINNIPLESFIAICQKMTKERTIELVEEM